MADKPPAKPKRQVKNPDTFRERALKANEASDNKVRSATRVREAVGKGTSPVLGPIGRILRVIFVRQPFIFISKLFFVNYFRNSWRELRQVTWPTLSQSRRLTTAVLIFATIFGLAIAALDYVLNKIFKQIIIN